jgi:hypothetical protein
MRGIEVSSRSRFVKSVARAFEDAGVDHVFLHGYEFGARDSDLDVAVTRESLRAVDLLLRCGGVGRLLQRLDHDVPWCRYYVVAAGEPGRRYRQLDVVCDPWGISKDGPAVRIALENRRRVDGLSVPEVAAEAVYLAVKRARKGADPAEAARLRWAFLADPGGTKKILSREFGAVGVRVAQAIEDDNGLEDALSALSKLLRHMRTSPISLVRRARYESRRVVHRLARPTGLVVGLAGPDGVGKSTLAAALERESVGVFRAARRLHLGPGLLPPAARLLGRTSVSPASPANPHARRPSGRAGSAARIAYLTLDTAVGWPTEVWLPRIRSTLVVLERGLLDLTVDPHRYRLRRAPRFIAYLSPVLPRPELTLLLDAPGTIIHERKRELSVDEIERQLGEWRVRAARRPHRFRVLDASRSEDSVIAQSLDAIDDVLAARQGQLDLASVAFECLGGVSGGGAQYTISSVRGQPRWLLPQGLGPLSTGLYRPASRRHYAAAVALANGARMARQTAQIDLRSGLAPLIAEKLGVSEVELAAALPRERRRAERVLLSALADRRVVAFAKVSRRASVLQREADVLQALAASRLRYLVVPDMVDIFEWRDFSVLLLRSHLTPGYADRDAGPSELAALIELAGLSDQLAPIIGSSPGSPPTHGDFCGWNSAPLTGGRLVLWDWEEVRVGVPLEDLFHWRFQRLVHFGHGTAATLVRGAKEPDAAVLALCSALDLDPSLTPCAALAACVSPVPMRVGDAESALLNTRVRRAVLTMLGEA